MKKIVKYILHTLGLKIQRIQPWMDNHKWLYEHDIKTIIDVGANSGQFANQMEDIFPGVKIYSFEPIPEVYHDLVINTKNLNIKTYNFGLGEKTGSLHINVNEFSPSSSFLELADHHKSNFSNAVTTQKESVKVVKLDDVLKKEDLNKSILTKIDVQGFEDKVINGGKEILSSSKIVFIEISFLEMYKGQKLFDDIYMQMKDLGFTFHGNMRQTLKKTNGRIIFGDAVFIKEDKWI